ncbi:MAG: hypothetical protein ABIE43_03425, partial [Patescibacteria group bacterium]
MRFYKVTITKIIFLAILIIVSFVFLNKIEKTEAAINKQINYQGKLTDSSSQAVSDGNYNITFRLYTSASSATTTNIWEEELTGDDRVTITSGLFSYLLGSSTPLTSVDFNQTLYLGIEIGGSGASPSWDGEMSPRRKIGAVPAAFEADKLDGIDSTSFLRSDTSDTMASSSASTLLTVAQNGSGDIVDIQDGANSVFLIANGGDITLGNNGILYDYSTGYLGIGTTSPTVLLAIGSTTPDKVSGYRDGYVAGSWEIDGLLYVDGAGTSTMANNLQINGGLQVGNSSLYLDSNSIENLSGSL